MTHKKFLRQLFALLTILSMFTQTVTPVHASPLQQVVVPSLQMDMSVSIKNDVNSNENPDPGDTLRYTVEIRNQGGDASNAQYTNTLPLSLTLVGGSVETTPLSIPQVINMGEDDTVTITLDGYDADGDPVTFSTTTSPLSGTLSGVAPSITYAPNLDFNGSDSFNFQVCDNSSPQNCDVSTVAINVGATNDAPVVDTAAFATAENAASGTGVGTVTFTDGDGGQSHTFSITAGNTGNVFAINASTGEITVNGLLDRETTASYNLTVQVDDDGAPPLNGNAVITINITDVNEHPVVSDVTFNISELSGTGDVVGTVAAADPESNPLTFAITAGNTGGAFGINANTGQITVADGAQLNYEVTPTYTLIVQATDNGTPGLSGTGTITVNLSNGNEAPVVTDATFAVDEGAANGTSVGTVSAMDPESNAITFAITAGNGSGAFAINTSTGEITVANSAVLDYETTPSFSLTVEGTDDQVPALTGSGLVTINVNNLNEAPVLVVGSINKFETIGNTELQVAASATVPTPHIHVNGSLLSNFTDSDGPSALSISGVTGCADIVAPFICATTNGGIVTLQSNGTFVFTPEAGNSTNDTFEYIVSDGSANATDTVTISFVNRVWYVKNNAATGGLGRSSDPFDTLAEAEAASSAGDTIYVYLGDGTTTGQNAGITMKSNQRLIGSGVALQVKGSLNGAVDPVLIAAGTQSRITHTAGYGVTVSDVFGVDIEGLDISGNLNGINVMTISAASGTVTIKNNTISAVVLEAVTVNAAGASVLTLDMQNNNITAIINALTIRSTNGTLNLVFNANMITSNASAMTVSTASGTIYITEFANNIVHQDTLNGFSITGVIFDAIPGGTFQTVNGGSITIGVPGDGVGGGGLLIFNSQGDLSFSKMDIYADSGAGLGANSTTAYTGAAGLRVDVGPGAVITANGGPALSMNFVTANLPSVQIQSTNSVTTGVTLANVLGTINAVSTSSISNAANMDFVINGGDATVTYAGTITDPSGQLVSVLNSTGGTKTFSGVLTGSGASSTGISLTNNTGATISFTGGVTLSTAANAAFTATGGGTIAVTGSTNTITTTTGTALNVANTNIGAAGLNFRSINANGAANGIVLNNTGTSAGNGGLIVTGTGSAGSGGTIQNTTGDGISLTNTKTPSLSYVNISNAGGNGVLLANQTTTTTLTNVNIVWSAPGGSDGINGNTVNGLTLTNCTITNAGNGAGENGMDFTNLSGTVSITNTSVTEASEKNIYIANSSGSLDLTFNNGSLVHATPAAYEEAINVQFTNTAAGIIRVTNSTLTGNYLGVSLSAANAGTLNYILTGNTISGSARQFDARNSSSALMQGRVENNQITATNAAIITSAVVNIMASGNSNHYINLNQNIVNFVGSTGIYINSFGGAGRIDAVLTNNTVSDAGAISPLDAVWLMAGDGTAGELNTLCLNMSGNDANSANGTSSVEDLYLRERTGTTVLLQGFGGSTTAQAATYILTNNPATGVVRVTAADGVIGTAVCNTTGIASLPMVSNNRSQVRARSVRVAPQPAGETILLNFPVIPAGKSVTIAYDAVIEDPLPAGTTQIVNQATLSGSNFTTIPSNDPSTSIPDDPTITSLALPSSLPKTGFAPGHATLLPAQPASLQYANLGNVWLEIPSQNIRAAITGVPISSQGWDLTWLNNQVGYLEGTAFPTHVGNSALTAHVYDANGDPGPFLNLGNLLWGQKVIVHAWGEKYTYEVRSVSWFVDPSRTSIITHEERSWLTLITCRGYNEDSDSYRWRTVVKAVLISVDTE